MANTIRGIIVFITIIVWISFICKHIESKELKKQIKLLCLILLGWIIIRITKYEFLKDDTIIRMFWYLYYIPVLFSSNVFLNIGTWHNKNKKYIKILKGISLVLSSILCVAVLTNDLHNLVFKINVSIANWEADYTYGILYYLCFVLIFINTGISIISATKYSKGLYKKQKIIILLTIFSLVFSYAIGYIIRIPIIFHSDFVLIYCLFYVLALIIIVYKEKYRLLLEENLYKEIECAIKDKTILINKMINNIDESENSKRDLAYIKLLISYCKNKGNLIVNKKNKEYYTSEELKLLLEETLKDSASLGILGAVNIINKFEISIHVTSIIYDFIYNLIEYANQYVNSNILICVEKMQGVININTLINAEDELITFEHNFELTKYINSKEISIKEVLEENTLNITLKIPINKSILQEKYTEKEIRALLEVKSKVHDILGQRLSLVSKIIEEENLEERKINEVKPLLKNILNDLENDKLIDPKEMLEQIIYTCELTGTKVYVIGNLPKNYIKAITLVKIIRECSTNAIRHAKAQNVYITIIQEDKTKMIISNDGNKVDSYVEGDGIKGIRSRVEELNDSLEIITEKEFVIKVTI